MRRWASRGTTLFLIVLLLVVFCTLVHTRELSHQEDDVGYSSADDHKSTEYAAPHAAGYTEESSSENGAEAVQEAVALLEKLKPSVTHTARFRKPSGILGRAAYYVKKAFTLLFVTSPAQHHVVPTKSQPGKLSQQLSQAVELLERAAAQENADAIYLLAEMNFYGNYTHPRDYSEALRWYKQSSDLTGNSSAQHMVGFMYATGIGDAVEQDQAKAMLYHTFAAEAGEARSQMTIAFRHHMGISAPRNCDEAVHFYKQTADKAIAYMKTGPPGGHMPTNDAYRYADEEGGVYGEGASVASSGRRAKQGHPNSDTWAAIDDVLEYLHVQSRKGDVKATLSIASLHYVGSRTLKRDLRTAKEYFLEVARKYWTKDGRVISDGPPGIDKLASKAAGYLGQMFLRGEGMEQNFHKARIWFKRGIENGDALCQYSTGLMYLEGLGVPRDPVKAATYFAPAADQDFAAAQVRLGAMFLDQGDVMTATRYFELAGRNGHMEALYYLAEMSNQGIGRDRSCGIAAVYYKLVSEKAELLHSSFREANEAFEDGDFQTALVNNMMAAEQGYEAAQANVAHLLDKSHTRSLLSSLLPFLHRHATSTPSALLALLYWTRSALQQNVDSLVKMGDYYLSGLGTSPSAAHPDPDKAASCYHAAAESLQSAQALWNLGWMHENGIGMPQDFHLAKRFYDQSAETNAEAYLPVQLALLKLRARSAWNGVTRGGVNGIREEPREEKRKWGVGEWVSAFLEADAAQNAVAEAERMYDGEDDWGAGGDGLLGEDLYEDVEGGMVETLVIVGLAAALMGLVVYRQQRRVRHRQGVEAGGHGHGQHGGGGEQQQGNEQREEEDDRGVFPRPEDPEFNNWVAGGVGH